MVSAAAAAAASADAAILWAAVAAAADIKFYPNQTRIVIQLYTFIYDDSLPYFFY